MTRPGDTLRHPAGDHQAGLVVHAMSPGVVQIPGDLSVAEAARLMRKEHAPCLLVKDTPTRIGIVTPTDIVYKAAALGLDTNEVEARSIMSLPVHAIEYDQTTEDAVTTMASKGVPLLIVTKLRQPIGVLTSRDLLFSPKRTLPRLTVSVKAHDGKMRRARHVASFSQLSHVGGVLETSAPLPPGTRLSLQFFLPRSSRPITARAIVLRVREETSPPQGSQEAASPAGMEVQFTGLSATDQSQIAAWALRTLYKQYGEQ